MPRQTGPLRLARLPEIPLAEIARHMSDPRVERFLPLLTGPWTEADAARFVATKEAAWARDGIGHWAILSGESYAGWGGIERLGTDWDLGLVLRPDHFGLGFRAVRLFLDTARRDPRISAVSLLLSPKRLHLAGLERLGARRTGFVRLEGERFHRYEIATLGPS